MVAGCSTYIPKAAAPTLAFTWRRIPAQGSRVNAFHCTYYDKSAAKSGSAYLVRTKMGVNEDLATPPASAAAGTPAPPMSTWRTTSSTNSQYAYFVYLVLPVSSTTEPPDSTDMLGCG